MKYAKRDFHVYNVDFRKITKILKSQNIGWSKTIIFCENVNKTHKLFPKKMVVEKPKQNIMFMAHNKKQQKL